MDCPDSCALAVEHDGAGRILQIRGRRDHPDTRGYICTKVARFARRQTHPRRILYPLRRVGSPGEGRFKRISWEEALQTIAARFQAVINQWGGEAIVGFHYGGSNGKLTDNGLDRLFFARLGASRLARTFCARTTGVVYKAMYGKIPGVAFADYVHARLIIIWGANPKDSNIHLIPYLKEARKRGARIVHIDPVRRFSSREVDLHLPIRPGTDLVLALALIHECEKHGALDTAFIEQYTHHAERVLEAARQWSPERAASVCDIPVELIKQIGHWYRTTDPAVIRVGWGLERNRNGGQAVAAILALPALTGKFGRRGAGFTLSNGYAIQFDEDAVFGPVEWQTRELNMSQLGRWFSLPEPEPPVRAVFIYNANPVVTAPNQNAVIRGLSRPDVFVVVHDLIMTDTARYADIVLPATTFLEHYDLKRGYGSMVVGGIRPLLRPPGEARSNLELFAALGRVMGFKDKPFYMEPEALYERAAEHFSMWNRPVNARRIREGGVDGALTEADRPILMKDLFPQTTDGRIDLCPRILGSSPYEYREADDPTIMGGAGPVFQLITPASRFTINSSMGEYDESPWGVRINPDDARELGCRAGQRVRLFNEYGEVVTRIWMDEHVRPGVLVLPKGAWLEKSLNGRTAAALCPDHVNEVGGGACYNDARVFIDLLEGIPSH